ncbi:hypothetical protein ETB97_012266 [Aspergillus alliaceus]|uniref:N-acetyltransferase domain-containing protein n=1 Tax=Petromyces alliaceus TaxID=209559 RepID=A0A8H5ZUU0_PETAA|nr:hypothetical protein ETB97_012266 [Aspergillus burnettii]
MSNPQTPVSPETWTKGPYLISTDTSLVQPQILNEWFASDEFYWANSLPLNVLEKMIQNCLCLGLYYQPSKPQESGAKTDLEFIGIARCITDYTTFVYLTDVYVHSDHQGKGLGSWLVKCVGEIIDTMPYVRRIRYVAYAL